MFGTNKITMSKVDYYYRCNDNIYVLYNIKGEPIGSFNNGNTYSCSHMFIHNVVTYGSTKNLAIFESFLKYVMNDKVLISIQNVSKNGYKELLKLGFTDYARLPGEYLSVQDKSLDVKSCLSIMILSPKRKSLKTSIKQTIEQLTNLTNEKN